MPKRTLKISPLLQISILICTLLLLATALKTATGADIKPPATIAQPNFTPIQTFIQKYCVECHGEKVAKSDLTLHVYRSADLVLKDRKIWEEVLDRVEGGEM